MGLSTRSFAPFTHWFITGGGDCLYMSKGTVTIQITSDSAQYKARKYVRQGQDVNAECLLHPGGTRQLHPEQAR